MSRIGLTNIALTTPLLRPIPPSGRQILVGRWCLDVLVLRFAAETFWSLLPRLGARSLTCYRQAAMHHPYPSHALARTSPHRQLNRKRPCVTDVPLVVIRGAKVTQHTVFPFRSIQGGTKARCKVPPTWMCAQGVVCDDWQYGCRDPRALCAVDESRDDASARQEELGRVSHGEDVIPVTGLRVIVMRWLDLASVGIR